MTFDTKRWLDDRHGEATLLGVCPMSEEIVEATIREATAVADLIPMFIATPRQGIYGLVARTAHQVHRRNR